ncbi:MAG: hypothetical protein LH645_06460 [Actinomycetia bacterium]|nr:hypothetical protein [Actinomycetes bacterium]
MDSSQTQTQGLEGQELAPELDWLTAELEARYPAAAPEQVAALVSLAADSFADARITDFVPVLVRREVEQELWSLGLHRVS